jgi:hypothetical protein
MVVASNLAGASNAIEASPSDTSLRSLDAVNLLLAAALSGFGPYVAVFLAEQDWTQPNIGFVLTAAGFAGLLAQLPGGGLLDAMRSKQTAVALGATMGAAAALIIAMWPSLPLVLAALVLQAITGGFLGLAVVAISLGLVGHDAGRAPRTQSAFRIDRRGSRDRPHGPERLFPLVSRDLLRRRRTGAAAALRSRQNPSRQTSISVVRYLTEAECVRLVNACEPGFRNCESARAALFGS